MIERIKFEKLEGFYDYDINLNPAGKRMVFLTGPNGYGKSKILYSLICICEGAFTELFSSVRFETASVTFTDKWSLSFSGKKVADDEEHYEVQLWTPRETLDSSVTIFHKGKAWMPPGDQKTWNRILFECFARAPKPLLQRSGENWRWTQEADMLKKIFKERTAGDGLGKRAELFQEMLEKSCFSNKKFRIAADKGFEILCAPDWAPLPRRANLSSGEQRWLDELFCPLFKLKKPGIMLMDQPEDSVHLAWQTLFLGFAEEILKIRPDMQYVVATDSPAIFRNKWGLNADLFVQTHPERYKHFKTETE